MHLLALVNHVGGNPQPLVHGEHAGVRVALLECPVVLRVDPDVRVPVQRFRSSERALRRLLAMLVRPMRRLTRGPSGEPDRQQHERKTEEQLGAHGP